MNEQQQVEVAVNDSTVGFFEKLSSFLADNHDVIFTVRKTGNLLSVAMMPRMLSADAKLPFSPLTLSGPAEEIDSDFFEKLTPTLSKTKAVMMHIKGYEDSLAKAKTEAESAKNKTITAQSKPAEVKPKPLQPDLFAGGVSADSSIQPKTL